MIDKDLSVYENLKEEYERLNHIYNLSQSQQFVPPGHFYSPINSQDEIEKYSNKIFDRNKRELPGIDFNEQKQLSLLKEFKNFYNEIPFGENKKENLRYYYDNTAFSYFDAISLYSMIRKYKPKRIIEIGSGFSSCVMLDTNELFFDHKIDLTFIEPYPELLHSLIKESDNQLIKIIPNKIQDVDLTVFKKLEAGDILFIDSTHVSKTYSDVNVIFFDILPRLPKGVIIHIHDIFFPFEYPEEWIREGRSWNEDYLLRAFLQFNNAFKIIFFNDYMTRFFTDELRQNLPLTLKNSGGSIWLEKTN